MANVFDRLVNKKSQDGSCDVVSNVRNSQNGDDFEGLAHVEHSAEEEAKTDVLFSACQKGTSPLPNSPVIGLNNEGSSISLSNIRSSLKAIPTSSIDNEETSEATKIIINIKKSKFNKKTNSPADQSRNVPNLCSTKPENSADGLSDVEVVSVKKRAITNSNRLESVKKRQPYAPLKKPFVIPRKLKNDKEILQEVQLDSTEYLREIHPILLRHHRDKMSKYKFSYEAAYIVNNEKLLNEFLEKKKEMKEEGRNEKEVADSYGFYYCANLTTAKGVSTKGLFVRSAFVNCLGSQNMGVYVSRYSDIIRPVLFVPNAHKHFIVIFRTMKGKVKSIQESYSDNVLEPTPNYDCHISKNAKQQVGFDVNQIYFYEYGDEDMVARPRQVCPFAVVKFTIKEHENSLKKVNSSFNVKETVPSVRFPSALSDNSEVKGQIVTKETALATEGATPSKEPDDVTSLGYKIWKGKLTNRKCPICTIELVSMKSPVTPLKLPNYLDLTMKMPIKRLKHRLTEKIFNISTQPLNLEEVFVNGRYYISCVCRVGYDDKARIAHLVAYLQKRKIATIVKLQENRELFFYTSDKEPTCSNLYCLFSSKAPMLSPLKDCGIKFDMCESDPVPHARKAPDAKPCLFKIFRDQCKHIEEVRAKKEKLKKLLDQIHTPSAEMHGRPVPPPPPTKTAISKRDPRLSKSSSPSEPPTSSTSQADSVFRISPGNSIDSSPSMSPVVPVPASCTPPSIDTSEYGTFGSGWADMSYIYIPFKMWNGQQMKDYYSCYAVPYLVRYFGLVDSTAKNLSREKAPKRDTGKNANERIQELQEQLNALRKAREELEYSNHQLLQPVQVNPQMVVEQQQECQEQRPVSHLVTSQQPNNETIQSEGIPPTTPVKPSQSAHDDDLMSPASPEPTLANIGFLAINASNTPALDRNILEKVKLPETVFTKLKEIRNVECPPLAPNGSQSSCYGDHPVDAAFGAFDDLSVVGTGAVVNDCFTTEGAVSKSILNDTSSGFDDFGAANNYFTTSGTVNHSDTVTVSYSINEEFTNFPTQSSSTLQKDFTNSSNDSSFIKSKTGYSETFMEFISQQTKDDALPSERSSLTTTPTCQSFPSFSNQDCLKPSSASHSAGTCASEDLQTKFSAADSSFCENTVLDVLSNELAMSTSTSERILPKPECIPDESLNTISATASEFNNNDFENLVSLPHLIVSYPLSKLDEVDNTVTDNLEGSLNDKKRSRNTTRDPELSSKKIKTCVNVDNRDEGKLETAFRKKSYKKDTKGGKPSYCKRKRNLSENDVQKQGSSQKIKNCEYTRSRSLMKDEVNHVQKDNTGMKSKELLESSKDLVTSREVPGIAIQSSDSEPISAASDMKAYLDTATKLPSARRCEMEQMKEFLNLHIRNKSGESKKSKFKSAVLSNSEKPPGNNDKKLQRSSSPDRSYSSKKRRHHSAIDVKVSTCSDVNLKVNRTTDECSKTEADTSLRVNSHVVRKDIICQKKIGPDEVWKNKKFPAGKKACQNLNVPKRDAADNYEELWQNSTDIHGEQLRNTGPTELSHLSDQKSSGWENDADEEKCKQVAEMQKGNNKKPVSQRSSSPDRWSSKKRRHHSATIERETTSKSISKGDRTIDKFSKTEFDRIKRSKSNVEYEGKISEIKTRPASKEPCYNVNVMKKDISENHHTSSESQEPRQNSTHLQDEQFVNDNSTKLNHQSVHKRSCSEEDHEENSKLEKQIQRNNRRPSIKEWKRRSSSETSSNYQQKVHKHKFIPTIKDNTKSNSKEKGNRKQRDSMSGSESGEDKNMLHFCSKLYNLKNPRHRHDSSNAGSSSSDSESMKKVLKTLHRVRQNVTVKRKGKDDLTVNVTCGKDRTNWWEGAASKEEELTKCVLHSIHKDRNSNPKSLDLSHSLIQGILASVHHKKYLSTRNKVNTRKKVVEVCSSAESPAQKKTFSETEDDLLFEDEEIIGNKRTFETGSFREKCKQLYKLYSYEFPSVPLGTNKKSTQTTTHNEVKFDPKNMNIAVKTTDATKKDVLLSDDYGKTWFSKQNDSGDKDSCRPSSNKQEKTDSKGFSSERKVSVVKDSDSLSKSSCFPQKSKPIKLNLTKSSSIFGSKEKPTHINMPEVKVSNRKVEVVPEGAPIPVIGAPPINPECASSRSEGKQIESRISNRFHPFSRSKEVSPANIHNLTVPEIQVLPADTSLPNDQQEARLDTCTGKLNPEGFKTPLQGVCKINKQPTFVDVESKGTLDESGKQKIDALKVLSDLDRTQSSVSEEMNQAIGKLNTAGCIQQVTTAVSGLTNNNSSISQSHRDPCNLQDTSNKKNDEASVTGRVQEHVSACAHEHKTCTTFYSTTNLQCVEPQTSFFSNVEGRLEQRMKVTISNREEKECKGKLSLLSTGERCIVMLQDHDKFELERCVKMYSIHPNEKREVVISLQKNCCKNDHKEIDLDNDNQLHTKRKEATSELCSIKNDIKNVRKNSEVQNDVKIVANSQVGCSKHNHKTDINKIQLSEKKRKVKSVISCCNNDNNCKDRINEGIQLRPRKRATLNVSCSKKGHKRTVVGIQIKEEKKEANSDMSCSNKDHKSKGNNNSNLQNKEVKKQVNSVVSKVSCSKDDCSKKGQKRKDETVDGIQIKEEKKEANTEMSCSNKDHKRKGNNNNNLQNKEVKKKVNSVVSKVSCSKDDLKKRNRNDKMKCEFGAKEKEAISNVSSSKNDHKRNDKNSGIQLGEKQKKLTSENSCSKKDHKIKDKNNEKQINAKKKEASSKVSCSINDNESKDNKIQMNAKKKRANAEISCNKDDHKKQDGSSEKIQMNERKKDNLPRRGSKNDHTIKDKDRDKIQFNKIKDDSNLQTADKKNGQKKRESRHDKNYSDSGKNYHDKKSRSDSRSQNASRNYDYKRKFFKSRMRYGSYKIDRTISLRSKTFLKNQKRTNPRNQQFMPIRRNQRHMGGNFSNQQCMPIHNNQQQMGGNPSNPQCFPNHCNRQHVGGNPSDPQCFNSNWQRMENSINQQCMPVQDNQQHMGGTHNNQQCMPVHSNHPHMQETPSNQHCMPIHSNQQQTENSRNQQCMSVHGNQQHMGETHNNQQCLSVHNNHPHMQGTPSNQQCMPIHSNQQQTENSRNQQCMSVHGNQQHMGETHNNQQCLSVHNNHPHMQGTPSNQQCMPIHSNRQQMENSRNQQNMPVHGNQQHIGETHNNHSHHPHMQGTPSNQQCMQIHSNQQQMENSRNQQCMPVHGNQQHVGGAAHNQQCIPVHSNHSRMQEMPSNQQCMPIHSNRQQMENSRNQQHMPVHGNQQHMGGAHDNQQRIPLHSNHSHMQEMPSNQQCMSIHSNRQQMENSRNQQHMPVHGNQQHMGGAHDNQQRIPLHSNHPHMQESPSNQQCMPIHGNQQHMNTPRDRQFISERINNQHMGMHNQQCMPVDRNQQTFEIMRNQQRNEIVNQPYMPGIHQNNDMHFSNQHGGIPSNQQNIGMLSNSHGGRQNNQEATQHRQHNIALHSSGKQDRMVSNQQNMLHDQYNVVQHSNSRNVGVPNNPQIMQDRQQYIGMHSNNENYRMFGNPQSIKNIELHQMEIHRNRQQNEMHLMLSNQQHLQCGQHNMGLNSNNQNNRMVNNEQNIQIGQHTMGMHGDNQCGEMLGNQHYMQCNQHGMAMHSNSQNDRMSHQQNVQCNQQDMEIIRNIQEARMLTNQQNMQCVQHLMLNGNIQNGRMLSNQQQFGMHSNQQQMEMFN
ncbi:uncharacterized protein LOC117119365 isoform X2 [Anneissia japonica]|uniref:uncharacterized protein LOC117119365 isoform X2 n=1 Tax=Anneissia japonica TaxID=1529436 RepID=UPI00142580B0|nr:uncharacterized protein LOC117119365 isoform X2 [Anneissia japonica]